MLYYVRSLIRKCECGFVTFLCLNKPTGQCKFCINVVKDTEKIKEKIYSRDIDKYHVILRKQNRGHS